MTMTLIGSRITRTAAALGVAGALAVSTGMVATPAFAAQSEQQFMCDGQAVTIRVNDNHSGQNGGWGAGIVDSGILIPTSFTFSAYDTTADMPLFPAETAWKGMGHANHNQQTISCSQVMSDTLANLVAQDGAPPEGLPEWASMDDVITITMTVTAVAIN